MDNRQIDFALSEIIRVAGSLVRCECLPGSDGEYVGKRRAAAMHKDSIRRANVLSDAVKRIREQLKRKDVA